MWNFALATDFEKAILQIEQGKGDEERSVLISKNTHQDLLSLKLPNSYEHEFIFRSQKRAQLSQNRVREIVSEAALKTGIKKKVSPHWFRHAHATHSYRAGAPLHVVQKTLGHKFISTTGLYLDSLPEESSGDYLDIWKAGCAFGEGISEALGLCEIIKQFWK